MEFDVTYDLVIVGSGGGSITAALVALSAGKKPLIVEKLAKVGGSTSFSGGVMWIPTNPFLGDRDSHEKARLYLDTLSGDPLPSSTVVKRDAFIRGGREMVEFIQSKGMRLHHAQWPDYYSAGPGGIDEGRSIVAEKFVLEELGEWAQYLGSSPMFPVLPIASQEARHLALAKRTLSGKLLALRVAGRMLWQKLTGKHLVGSGLALQGRMLQIALRNNIPIWRETPVEELLVEDGRVVGVVARREGKSLRIGATAGVLLDAGGFSQNRDMREQYSPKPTGTDWAIATKGDTGEVMRMAMGLGAATDLMDEAIWVPASFLPDGRLGGIHVPSDSAKPHSIIVGKDGKRFANEACSYMEFGQRMYAAGAVPAWAILESRNRARYPWGLNVPGFTAPALIDNGYFVKANSIAELAEKTGIDAAGLTATIETFNGYADRGDDPEFGRGRSHYNRVMGDRTHKPNANLGRIEQPPFYACRIWPADVGTGGGLVTDENARVLREDGSPIPGLYATGSITASVMGRCYPGAGASIGPAFTFGYLGARHALGVNR